AVNHEVFTEIRPLRDVFASVFFVTLGFQFPYDSFLKIIIPILALSAFVIVVKILVVFIVSIVLNYHSKIAFYSAFALFEVGEFSFVLGKMGTDSKILSPDVHQILIFTTIFTLVISPFVFELAPSFYEKFKKYSHKFFPFLYNLIFVKADSDAKMPRPRKLTLKNHVVLVGYGRVGKFISKLLEISKIDFVVIDMHYKILYSLRKRGFKSIYGDAVNREILEIANLKEAKSIIIATPDIVANELIIQNVREINPSCLILVRAHKEEDIARLAVRGIKHIIEPEFEAGVEMGKRLLKYSNVSGKTRAFNVKEMRREYKF
nr:NAD-binding protein [Patescibacteria group bacterium]